MRDAGPEAKYLYPHDYPGGWVAQEYLPGGGVFYEPGENGREKALREAWKRRTT